MLRRLHTPAHTADMNWAPLSDVTDRDSKPRYPAGEEGPGAVGGGDG
jgi:hypothetical protein